MSICNSNMASRPVIRFGIPSKSARVHSPKSAWHNFLTGSCAAMLTYRYSFIHPIQICAFGLTISPPTLRIIGKSTFHSEMQVRNMSPTTAGSTHYKSLPTVWSPSSLRMAWNHTNPNIQPWRWIYWNNFQQSTIASPNNWIAWELKILRQKLVSRSSDNIANIVP